MIQNLFNLALYPLSHVSEVSYIFYGLMASVLGLCVVRKILNMVK